MAHASVEEQLGAIAAAIDEIAAADARQLDELKTGLLGRKAGALTHLLRSIPTLEPDQRKAVGRQANELKGEIEAALAARARALAAPSDTGPELDATMPFGRVCQPEDVANVVRFLVSDANSYLTGERLYCDGGGPLQARGR